MILTLRTLLHRRLSQALPSISRVSNPPFGEIRVSSSLNFSTGSGSFGGGGKDNDDAWDNAWTGNNQSQSTGGDPLPNLDWGELSSWSTGLTKDHFDGAAIGLPIASGSESPPSPKAIAVAMDEEDEMMRLLEKDNKENKKFVDGWGERMMENYRLLKQVREPGAREEYLKDSEKAEMFILHKEDPEVYTVERLAKDYRVMRQRVHAILWLKEMEEEEEKKQGKPLDDSVEILLDNFPEFFNSHDREFHVASLPYKPDFKVMPEGWDGTTRDPDEVLYEISMKEDQMLYEEFVQRLNFNKKKVAGEVKCHKYSRRRPAEGWSFTVEKLGACEKRGGGGGWKFVSLPDGSSRALNEMEKMYVKRETPKRRRRILPPFK